MFNSLEIEFTRYNLGCVSISGNDSLGSSGIEALAWVAPRRGPEKAAQMRLCKAELRVEREKEQWNTKEVEYQESIKFLSGCVGIGLPTGAQAAYPGHGPVNPVIKTMRPQPRFMFSNNSPQRSVDDLICRLFGFLIERPPPRTRSRGENCEVIDRGSDIFDEWVIS